MRQLIFNLSNTSQRPIVLLKDFHNYAALLDTGAYFPIWTADEGILTRYLEGKLIKKEVPFGGFGGQTVGNLYCFTFTLGELIFPNMHIITCSDLNVPFHMILSATMFRNLIYEVDDKNHKLNVTVPESESCVRNLVIKDESGMLHVLCSNT